VSSLLSAGGALILMVVLSFFAGRSSVGERSRGVETARATLGDTPAWARDALPAPARPCWVARQPRLWAPLVAKSIPFDVAPTSAGALAVGYARSSAEAVGIEVDPGKGAVAEVFSRKVEGAVARVFPTPGRDEKFAVTLEAEGAIRSAVHVGGASPLVVGLAEGAVVAAERAGEATTSLWQVSAGEGREALDALRVAPAGAQGHAVTFRRDKAIWGGWIGPRRTAVGQLTQVTGSGGAIGKPSLGWNGREVAVVFADRPADGRRWEIRVGRAPFGEMPAATQVFPLPEGGPGGDAFAPDITGLPDGRWLLVWTEGPAGSRAMRAQTLGADLAPAGDPIALSPPAGNFGQGILGVAGTYVGAVFLSKPAATYELWGVILQCG
jgi:hypothetical protein